MTRLASKSGLLLAVAALALAGCNHKTKYGVKTTAPAATVSSGSTAGSTSRAIATRLPAAPVASLPATSTTPPASSTPTTGQGSRFWYENDTFGQPLKRNDAAEAALAAELLVLHNQERAKAGLPALAMDSQAEQAAKAHAEDMLGRSFFDHITPEGWNPDDRLKMTGASGYNGWGENIILGYPTAKEMTDAWMASPGHRANILSPQFTHIGFGIASNQGPYAAAVFLTR